MKKMTFCYIFILIFTVSMCSEGQDNGNKVTLTIFPDSVLSDVSKPKTGINLNYFMDDDVSFHPQRRTVDALKEMGIKFLRYPGGNKSDFYFFSKPPYEKSEPTLARTGRRAVHGRNFALNENATDFRYDVLDFDEFIVMCREIEAEPVIVVAGDEYDRTYPEGSTWSTREQLIEHATEWVRYANVKKKYDIKYWMIANEPWVFQPNTSIYANDVVDFSKAMKSVDPTIKIIPSGVLEHEWQTIFTICSDYIDEICISNYPVNTTDTIFSYFGSYNPIGIAVESIEKYGTAQQKKEMKVIVAEFGPFNFARDGENSRINNQLNNLINFEIAGYQLIEPRVEFSCFWNTRWNRKLEEENVSAYDALDTDGNLNANGYGLMIWGNYLADKMIKTTSSDRECVSVFSSLTPSENKLYVYILNKTNEDIETEIIVKGKYSIRQIKQCWELRGQDLDDQKPIWSKLKEPVNHKFQTIPKATIRVFECNI